jgi:hypothetical protein
LVNILTAHSYFGPTESASKKRKARLVIQDFPDFYC